MSGILEVIGLGKKYKGFALKDISFSLPRGYIMGLIGPNGAGKTTTIKLIMNLLTADHGSVKIFGQGYENHEEEIKNGIGYVGEEQYYYEDATVNWTAGFVSKYYRNWNNEKFEHLIDKLDITKTKKIKELSKGMKVKLSIALALSHNPRLLILDEPTSGLDPVIRKDILDMLLEVMQDDNNSILFSSHITEDIEKIADYVTYIVDGRILLTGEKEEILSNWKKVHVQKKFVTPSIKNNLTAVRSNMFGVSGMTDNSNVFKRYLETIDDPDGIKIENASLDDILMSLVKEGE